MSSSNDNWGGDYSFLLQSIEGRISENIVNKTPQQAGSKSAQDESSSKRRWSDFQSPMNDIEMSSAKKLKSFAEIDELMIVNEQLRDSIARMESERQIAKEEHVRQLKFLDDRCTSLKKESTERLEKYYEEKKKWQSKHRELELQIKKLGTAAQCTSQQPATPSSTNGHNAHNEEVLHRLRVLERELTDKVTESRENLKGKLSAESKLFETEMELKTLRSSVGAGSMTDEALLEARTLRKQYADLESVHKRTARDHDSMKAKLKNQALLEEELSTLKAKLRLTEEKLNTFKQDQIAYQHLLAEKNMWTQMFHEITAKPEHSEVLDEDSGFGRASSTGSTASSVSPTTVLQLLSAYQSRCAVLLQGQGELQRSLSEMRRQAREAQAQHLDSEAALHSTQTRLETVEHQLRTALQQGRLYDGEIRSLRSLLETYDLEFRIGKPDAVKVMALKDRLATELRAELDGARQNALALAAQLRTLEGVAEERAASLEAKEKELLCVQEALSAASANASAAIVVDSTHTAAPTTHSSTQAVDVEKATQLQVQLEEARYDLQYLQHVTGLDYMPDRTRVLHMPQNPTSAAPAVTTLPTVTELRRQRAAYQQQLNAAGDALLHAQQEATNAAAAAQEEGETSGVSNASSSAPTTGNAHALNTTTGVGGAAPPAASAQAVADNAVMNLRLKEQFKERITSFREAVYLLTGYKVDMFAADGSPNSLPRLRLRSMYAEKPEDNLLFQMRGDSPELLSTEFASRLSQDILFQLNRFNSVPAFLSAVTLDLVERQTM